VKDAGAGGQTVLLADADRRFRRRAAHALVAAGLRVREAGTGREALAGATKDAIALAILDVRLDDPSGYEVCRRLREEYGEALPIMFVSSDRTESFDRVAGFLLGADDYLVKPIAPDELVARVRRHLRRLATWNGAGIRLTSREREVLELLADGMSPAQIADSLGISPKTVGTHVEHIYAKLGVHTRAQAVVSAFRLSLVGGR
jgi:DNA-binding NarL/FixJ family response regulator